MYWNILDEEREREKTEKIVLKVHRLNRIQLMEVCVYHARARHILESIQFIDVN